MYQLLRFFSRLKVFLTFLLLEIVAIWLIVNNNSYQQVAFLTSANAVSGNFYELRDAFTGQFNLRNEIEQLQEENAKLRQRKVISDSTSAKHFLSEDFNYIPARIINNTVSFEDNYITLNRGRKNGIREGMGIIAPNGIIGRIKNVTENFSAAYSILHSGIRVSAQFRASKELCTVKWNAEGTKNNFQQAELLYVPLHVNLQIGDTVETSGYNTVFPEGINIGTVSSIEDDMSDGRKKVKINLFVNFNNVKNAYVIENYQKSEIDSLTRLVNPSSSE